MRWHVATAVLLSLLISVTARAEDEPTTEGELRAGWRLLSGESDGRFRQDHALRSGPLLFDAHVLYEDPGDERLVESLELDASDWGDARSSARLRLRTHDDWSLDASFHRDDHSYRATGDPFPYETLRKRSRVELERRVGRRLRLYARWDRTTREGRSFAFADTNLRELPAPAGVDGDLVRTRRPFGYRLDRYELGFDAREGVLRFGLSQRFDVRTLDDERFYAIPPDRRGSTPAREAFDRTQRGHGWTTVGKLGATLLDGDLDLSLVGGWTRMPLESRIHVDRVGFDNDFAAGSVRGAFEGPRTARHRTRRLRRTWRFEGLWTPHDDWEFVLFGEGDDTIDDARLRVTDRRRYERPDLGVRTTHRRVEARITDRTDRVGFETAWDATESVRLRAGHEWATIDLEVPTDSPGGSLSPTDLHSRVRRATVGLDWDPDGPLDTSVLARRAHDEEPQSARSFERSDELKVRARWRPGGPWSASAGYSTKGARQEARLDSSSRSETLTLSGTWADDEWTVTGSALELRADTRTATRFFRLDGFVLRRVRDAARFETRDRVVSLHVARALSSRLDAFLRVTWSRSGGDYRAVSHEASVGAEYELSATWSAGLTVRSFRLDERDERLDDVSAEALELSATYRF